MQTTKENKNELNKIISKPAIHCGCAHTHLILKREIFDAIFVSIYNAILKTNLCGFMT